MQGLAAHTARNLDPILEVLRHEFRDRRDVLEIGSGNGQHATEICRCLDHLSWQTSDVTNNHPTIQAWLDSAGVASVKSPLTLDVRTEVISSAIYDAVFSANTAHIMSIAAVENMFAIAGDALRGAGIFCLYGPFRLAGRFNADSNAHFHQSLRTRDPDMGIRDLEQLDDFADCNNLQRAGRYAMPSNNMLVLWQQSGEVSR